EHKVINLETVGSAFWNKSDIPVNFNFLNKNESTKNVSGKEIKIGNITFYLTPKLFQNILIGLIVFSLLIVVGTYLACAALNSSIEIKSADLTAQKTKLESNVNSTTTPTPQINTNDIINKTFEKNGKILQSFNALGSVIPEKVWIDSFELKDDLNASINGKSYSVDDIVAYYQNLIRSAYFQNLKISAIKVVGGNSETGSNNPVSIISKNEEPTPNSMPNLSSLPSLPNLPSINQQKYYEFSFGNSLNATVSSSSSNTPSSPSPNPQPMDQPAGPMDQLAGP
ncbi:MAG: PilN domain-containing protein, partial [Candidatus Gastranaerophilales bacterium]|nr:PilN domain-containing protein [Candidatus Gastranaerophilales bacterium]